MGAIIALLSCYSSAMQETARFGLMWTEMWEETTVDPGDVWRRGWDCLEPP